MKKIWKWFLIGMAAIVGYMVTCRSLEDKRDFR